VPIGARDDHFPLHYSPTATLIAISEEVASDVVGSFVSLYSKRHR
jgi:hypothetical protein